MVRAMGADCTRALLEEEPGSRRIDIWPSCVTAGSVAAAPCSVVQEGLALSNENGVPALRDAANARAMRIGRIPYEITSEGTGDWGLGIRNVQNRDWVRLANFASGARAACICNSVFSRR